MRISNLCSIAHQTADFGGLPEGIDRRHFVVSRQRDKLRATVVGQRARTYQEGINRLLRKVCKGRIDVVTCTDKKDFELLLDDRSRRTDIREKGLSSGKAWIRQ